MTSCGYPPMVTSHYQVDEARTLLSVERRVPCAEPLISFSILHSDGSARRHTQSIACPTLRRRRLARWRRVVWRATRLHAALRLRWIWRLLRLRLSGLSRLRRLSRLLRL